MIRVICINNSNNTNDNYRLIIGKKYNVIKYNDDILYHVYNDDFSSHLGLFPFHLFKDKNEYRKERLKNILNGI